MTMASIDWLRVAQISQALLTPVIGIATVGVGVVVALVQRQQAITNRLQHRLALFDRRMKIFDSTMALIIGVLRTNKAELDDLFRFIRETREHELLFGSEIGEYIDQIYKKGVNLELIEATRNNPKPEDFAKRTELLEWFVQQSKLAPFRFLKYVDFREP